jgi:hypothetical protein
MCATGRFNAASHVKGRRLSSIIKSNKACKTQLRFAGFIAAGYRLPFIALLNRLPMRNPSGEGRKKYLFVQKYKILCYFYKYFSLEINFN